MLHPRIIPCLLVRDRGLVKTFGFGESKYVGDPINAVKIFNEKEVDELVVLDIDATAEQREPDYKMIENLAAECRMPLCYGGGVKTAAQASRIFSLGVEKVSLSSAAIERSELVSEISAQAGAQSVVVTLDVKKKGLFGKYNVLTHNAQKNTGMDPVELAAAMQKAGAGEIVLNSIDNDGAMKGYDLKLIDRVRAAITVPMTVIGGAGTLDDISTLIKKHPIIGASAGSLFVFKGKYKAVLINYPNRSEKARVLTNANIAS